MALAIDLFCGLGGWTDGLLAEGWTVVGFDVERHAYGEQRYPAQLVLQDVLTIHGSQFRHADLIVASPPCQQYSWLAMPWSRSKDPNNSKAAKALRHKWQTEGPDNRLFDACFRIQREAIYARRLELRCCNLAYSRSSCPRCHIPMVVENVRGAQEWVGRAPWNYGSFYLWGDVPALMPINLKRAMKANPDGTNYPQGSWFAIADSSQGDRRGIKVPGQINGTEYAFTRAGAHGQTVLRTREGTKFSAGTGGWFGDYKTKEGRGLSQISGNSSRSKARKAASAMIAKIPLPLSTHIARVYWPIDQQRPVELPATAAGTSGPASVPEQPVSA